MARGTSRFLEYLINVQTARVILRFKTVLPSQKNGLIFTLRTRNNGEEDVTPFFFYKYTYTHVCIMCNIVFRAVFPGRVISRSDDVPLPPRSTLSWRVWFSPFKDFENRVYYSKTNHVHQMNLKRRYDVRLTTI